MNKALWSRTALALQPYIPGEQPKVSDLIKLNTNENPYPPSPKVLIALQECANADLRLYPDPESSALKSAIANRHGLSAAQIFVGNGSDEVLAFAFQAFFDKTQPLFLADISYSFYRVYCNLFAIPAQFIALTEDFSIPIEQFHHAPNGVVLANPNAPTGKAVSLAQIDALCAHNTRMVLVDEAYIEFGKDGAQSALPLLDKHENLLIVRTFSKSHALAGLRIGYAMGHPDAIAALSAVKNSFNSYPLDRVAQSCGIAAMQDEAYHQATLAAIAKTRETAMAQLQALGFACIPSQSNFIFARHPKHTGANLLKELKEHGILVRRFDEPRIEDYLRITIGTDEQMQRLYYSLKNIQK